MTQPDIAERDATTREVPFPVEELFFSRTDKGGIIQSGNSVFQRISQYGWSELIKKPHKLIRHPDMPRGVFHLFWETIKQDKPIGAYVKNRAKDGRYYWVFAIATPLEDGYLSVRLKPSSEIFAVVREAYQTLLALEKRDSLTPDASAQILLGELAKLGFGSYAEFMSAALRQECAARNAALVQAPDPMLEHFSELNRMASELKTETERLFNAYDASRYVPMNLQVQSCQLGNEGRAMGVISNNYTALSHQMRADIDTFTESSRAVFDTIFEGQFLLCTARIQGEVASHFAAEAAQDGVDRDREMALLLRQARDYQARARAGLNSILERIDAFQDDCRRIKMCAASLEVIRVMGKVDAARLSGQAGALHELIEDLRGFQGSVTSSLNVIAGSNLRMRAGTQAVISALQSAALPSARVA